MKKVLTGILSLAAMAASPANGQAYGKLAHKQIDFIEPAILKLGSGVVLKDEYPFLLVRIEYPAGITEAGVNALVAEARAYLPLASKRSDDELRARVLDQFNKSAYFAYRLQKHFIDSGRFPAQTVASRGVMLDAAASGVGIVTLRRDTEVPAVVTLRFSVQRNPEADISTANPDGTWDRIFTNTFSDYVTPAIAVLTEPAAWPGSAGVIAVHGTKRVQGNIIQSCNPANCLAAGPDLNDELEHRVNTSAAHSMGALFSMVKDRLPFGKVIYAAPLGKFNIRPVNTCLDTPADIGPACLHERIALSLTVQALSQVDPYLATRSQLRQYIELVDPSLAKRWPGAIDTPGPRQRLSFIKALMLAERSYLASVSAKQMTSLLEGPIGGKLRLQRMSERTYAQSVVDSSRTQFDLGSFLGAVATVGQFATAFKNKDFVAQNAATLQMQRIESAPIERSKLAQAGLSAAFGAGTAQTYRDLFGASYPAVIAGKSIQADSLADLRQQFKQAYSTSAFPPAVDGASDCPSRIIDGERLEYFGICDSEFGGILSGNENMFQNEGGGRMGTAEASGKALSFNSVILYNFSSVIYEGKYVELTADKAGARVGPSLSYAFANLVNGYKSGRYPSILKNSKDSSPTYNVPLVADRADSKMRPASKDEIAEFEAALEFVRTKTNQLIKKEQ